MKKSKRLLSLLLSIVMLFGVVFSVNASAYATVYSTEGKIGDNITYKYDNSTGVMTLSGKGEIADQSDYSWEAVFSGRDDIKEVIIGDGITSIGNNLFNGCVNIKKITLPEGLLRIGKNAFSRFDYSTQYIDEINIPSSVTTIEAGAFRSAPIVKLYSDIDFGATDKITVGDGNIYLLNAPIRVKSTDPKGEWTQNADKTETYCSLEGVKLVDDIFTVDGEKYAFDKDGKMITGWHNVGEAYYYFDQDGKMLFNDWVKGYWGWYYLGVKGEMITDDFLCFRAINSENDTIYYLDANGVLADDGWTYVGDYDYLPSLTVQEWIYAYPNGMLAVNTWINDSQGPVCLDYYGTICREEFYYDELNMEIYYTDINGRPAQEGWIDYDTNPEYYDWYYVFDGGRVATNTWLKDSKGWLYADMDGSITTDTFIEDSHGVLYLGEDGYPLTNQLIVDAPGYSPYLPNSEAISKITGPTYADEDGYLVNDGWRYVVNEYYEISEWLYFGSDYNIVTNKWVQDSHGWLYLDEDGLILKSDAIPSQQDENNIYIVDSNGYLCGEGWNYNEIYDMWFYIESNGFALKYGWIQDSVGWCYIDDCIMVTDGWIYDNNNIYYADAYGHIVYGDYVVDGKLCHFDEAGHFVSQEA